MWNLFARTKVKTARREKTLRVESLEPRAMAASVAPSHTLGQPKMEIVYEVTEAHSSSRKVEKMIAKKDVLTLHNLPPGNYTVSYNPHVDAIDHVMSHH